MLKAAVSRHSRWLFRPLCHCFLRRSSSSHSREGLFAIPGLHKPSDFLRLAADAVAKCNSLRSASILVSGETDTAPVQVLHLLDEISNTICSVIDASELCRSVHVDARWRNSAGDAFQTLSEYIAELNADVTLYRSLLPITANTRVMEQLTEEERRMALGLKREFERDGIHLNDIERIDLQQRAGHVVQLETIFTENITKSSKSFHIEDGDAVTKIVPVELLHGAIHPRTGAITLSTDSYIPNVLLKYSESSTLRKEVYMALHTSCEENLPVLDALIAQRNELSRRMGFPSYAHRFLSDKMAQRPEAVMTFLKTVMNKCQLQYQKDMQSLSQLKRKVEGDGEIKPWDMNFYSALAKYPIFGEDGSDSALVGHFTLKNCIDGMKELVHRLFGITMVEATMNEGERWDSDEMPCLLHKFEFYHQEKDRLLGIMYLDLAPREGKYVHSAHFTVRCGCSIRNGSNEENTYQIPTIALICNLSPSYADIDSEGLLTHSEVETVFHEFGHALHSLLSRTSFQHLSGTRVAMDFVETPSHLMEHFVWNKEFLRIIGKHHLTQEPLSDKTIERLIQSRFSLKAIDIQTQLIHSFFDQTIFGPRDTWQDKTTIDVFNDLHRTHHFPYAAGTHWFSRFGHLITYGAGYYSYLYSNIFASDIWDTCFESGNAALSRKSGEKLWKNLLIHGGSKDPNMMLIDLLGREPV